MKALLRNTVSKLNFFKIIRSYVNLHKKSRLPKGVTEFNAWADELISIAEAPDNDSLRFTLAAMILNLPPATDEVPKIVFVRQLRKAMSSEIASGIMYQLKEKQKAEAQKQKELEAASNVQG